MRFKYHQLVILMSSLTFFSCSSPLVKTYPEEVTDTGDVIITCNARMGNQGLLDYSGPVYVHLGLITDSSMHPNDWRYVKFNWGSTEAAALATPEGNNKWSYKINGIRKYFGVKNNEKILELKVLFRSGNCIDTLCKVLRNPDKTDMLIPLSQQ